MYFEIEKIIHIFNNIKWKKKIFDSFDMHCLVQIFKV
jgi:hypothetical protein